MSDKIPFDSLKSGDKSAINKIVTINGKEIVVKQYLPIDEKLNLTARVLSAVSGNEYSFVNPVHVDVYTIIEILKAYTNIEFAEDALPAEIYDTLIQEKMLDPLVEAIPVQEFNYLTENIRQTADAYYNYKNSVLGILEAVSTDYSNLNFDADEIQKKIADPDNLTLLKDVMNKLG